VQVSAARAVDIDFSKPKRLSKVSTPDYVSSVVPVDATQPSEENMQTFFQTNSKSIAQLNAFT